MASHERKRRIQDDEDVNSVSTKTTQDHQTQNDEEEWVPLKVRKQIALQQLQQQRSRHKVEQQHVEEKPPERFEAGPKAPVSLLEQKAQMLKNGEGIQSDTDSNLII